MLVKKIKRVNDLVNLLKVSSAERIKVYRKFRRPHKLADKLSC